MAERDADIEFDFFDEPETREAARATRRSRGGPRRPIRPPAGITPLLRLVGLIAFAILLIVLLVFWIKSCRESSTTNSYRHYMEKASAIANDSQRDGRRLTTLFTTPAPKEADLQRGLAGLANQEELNVERARDLDPPGRLLDEHQHLIEALQFRVSGLTGLADTFRRTTHVTNVNNVGTVLASQASRLLASDVIWDDKFRDPAKAELRHQGIGGVQVPNSHFLQNPDLGSQKSLVSVVERVRGAATGAKPSGGIRGTNIVSVKVLPSGTQLSPSTENKVVTSENLAIEVTIEDSGESQEVRLPVTLTIDQNPPVKKETVLELINPGEQKPVVFKNFTQPDFTRKHILKVTVQPVENEKTVSNNTAEYPILFSLPG
jgi:hypothetical protein